MPSSSAIGEVEAFLLDRLLRDQRLLELRPVRPGWPRARPRAPCSVAVIGRAVLADLPAVLQGLEGQERVEGDAGPRARAPCAVTMRGIGVAELAPAGLAALPGLCPGPGEASTLARGHPRARRRHVDRLSAIPSMVSHAERPRALGPTKLPVTPAGRGDSGWIRCERLGRRVADAGVRIVEGGPELGHGARFADGPSAPSAVAAPSLTAGSAWLQSAGQRAHHVLRPGAKT